MIKEAGLIPRLAATLAGQSNLRALGQPSVPQPAFAGPKKVGNLFKGQKYPSFKKQRTQNEDRHQHKHHVRDLESDRDIQTQTEFKNHTPNETDASHDAQMDKEAHNVNEARTAINLFRRAGETVEHAAPVIRDGVAEVRAVGADGVKVNSLTAGVKTQVGPEWARTAQAPTPLSPNKVDTSYLQNHAPIRMQAGSPMAPAPNASGKRLEQAVNNHHAKAHAMDQVAADLSNNYGNQAAFGGPAALGDKIRDVHKAKEHLYHVYNRTPQPVREAMRVPTVDHLVSSMTNNPYTPPVHNYKLAGAVIFEAASSLIGSRRMSAQAIEYLR